jgi:hypothetical protein
MNQASPGSSSSAWTLPDRYSSSTSSDQVGSTWCSLLPDNGIKSDPKLSSGSSPKMIVGHFAWRFSKQFLCRLSILISGCSAVSFFIEKEPQE